MATIDNNMLKRLPDRKFEQGGSTDTVLIVYFLLIMQRERERESLFFWARLCYLNLA